MQDKKLIEIACIKDISLIYCRILESDNSSKYLEVEIVYDGKRKMRLNYRDKYFATFFKKVINTYHIEKNKTNIVLLGSETEDIISNYKVEEQPLVNGTDYNFYPLNTSKFYIDIMSDYLKQALKEILKSFYIDNKIIINDIKGYRNRYIVTCEIDEKSYQIPLMCYLNNKYNLLFKLTGIKKSGLVINGYLIIKDQYIHINWNSTDDYLKGKIVADIDNGFNEIVLSANDVVFDIRQENNLVSNDELDLINHHLNLLNLKTFSKAMKINDSNYLMYDEIINDKLRTNYACHMTIKNNIISIIYDETFGHIKYDSQIFIPFKNNHYRINILDNIVQIEDLNHNYFI